MSVVSCISSWFLILLNFGWMVDLEIHIFLVSHIVPNLSNTSLSDFCDSEMKIGSKKLGSKKESELEKVGLCERLHDLFLTLN